MTEKIATLLKNIKEKNIDSLFITSPANVFYVSNYYTDPHERLLAIYIHQKHEPLLIIPAMEVNDAKDAGWPYNIIGYYDHENPWEMFSQFLDHENALPQTIGLEQNHISFERYLKIKELLPKSKIIDANEVLASMRLIKNKKEYTILKRAASLADFGIETGVKAIRNGATEMDIIAEIEYQMKKQGIQEMSFSTLVLSGPKTASPHGQPGMRNITSGDLVLMDLGIVFDGYCSDITRTVAYQSITDEQKKIYEIVLTAEQKAIKEAKLGNAVGELDQIARNHIQQNGYGQYFTHRIGHGIGIDVHEYPSMHSNNQWPLQVGMCFTIEPGIYVPKQGGVRIEDMVFVTEKGPEVLTSYPTNLQIID